MKWLLAFFPVIAYADTGLSYLALCHPKWPCKESLMKLSNPKVVGWLDHTFGTKCECAKTFLNQPGEKIIRVHLLNGPCMRNRRCGPYEPFYGLTIAQANRLIHKDNRRLLGKVTRASLRLAKLLRTTEELTCYVSPCLECDIDNAARKKLINIVKQHLPQCVPVDNPVHHRCLRDVTCEKHGPKPKLRAPCIADLDGVPLEEVDVEHYLAQTKQCDIQFLWSKPFNCIAQAAFVDPQKRDCSKVKTYLEKAL